MATIDFGSGTWLNEPPEWSLDSGTLAFTTGDRTDFWQGTLYGFRRDDGHALLVPVDGEFTAVLTFEGDYRALYDQAGLMLRADASRWVKLGVEYSDGATNFSVVVTRGQSDWSVVRVPGLAGPQRVRLTRVGGAIVAHLQAAGGSWQLMRVADLELPSPVLLGPMACSPQRAGFAARFTELTVEPPIADPIHAV